MLNSIYFNFNKKYIINNPLIINNYTFVYSLLKVFGNKFIKNINVVNNEINIIVNDKKKISFLLLFLKNHYKYQYKQLTDICVIDFFFKVKRFTVHYNLLSLKYKVRARVMVYLEEQEMLLSNTHVFSSANWLEREVWDLFGIFFNKHSDLRRILTDYGFNGFPFRKDFPLSGYIELRFDDENKAVVYENLEMTQEFRYFEFTSPWNWYVS